MRPPTTIEIFVCHSLQYAKLVSLFQNSPTLICLTSLMGPL